MPTEGDKEAARQLAAEMAESGTRSRRTWRKVTTLLDHFGYYRLTTPVRGRMAAALAEVGLEVDPPLTEAERYGTVRFSVLGPKGIEIPQEDQASPAELPPPKSSLWLPGQSPRPFDSASQTSEGIRVFDVEAGYDPGNLLETLAPQIKGELTLDMIEDVLDADPLPKVDSSHSEDGRIRAVSSVAVYADEGEGDERNPNASKAGQLVFQLVEFLAGPNWLITCWHRAKRYSGEKEIAEEEPRGKGETERSVARHWASRQGLATTGDLGLVYLHELASTYPDARQEIYSWLESWEIDFYKRQDTTETETLTDVRGLMIEFRERLVALNQPGMSRKRFLVWFQGFSDYENAEEVDELIDRSLRSIGELREQLRTSFEMVSASNSRRQLMLAQQQERQGERLQGQIERIAAILLVPTLVATVYGANTDLPGRNTWAGFELLLALMIVSAVLAYVVIQIIHARLDRRADESERDAGEEQNRRRSEGR